MHSNKSNLLLNPTFLHPSESTEHRIFDPFRGQQKDTIKLCIAGEGRGIMKKLSHLFGQILSCGKLRKSATRQGSHEMEI